MKLVTVSNLPFNLDHKMVATAVTTVLVYVLTALVGLELSEEVRGAISVLVGTVVAYFVPPALAVDANAPGMPTTGGYSPPEGGVHPDPPSDYFNNNPS